MCGRYELNANARDLGAHFAEVVAAQEWETLGEFGSYNIAPSQSCVVIRYSKPDGCNVVERLLWGFRPHWSERRWINARAETLFETVAFREAASRRRCLVVATGWYEWQATGGQRKQPFHLRLDGPFAFAGIWTARRRADGEWELSFAIVTVPASGAAGEIHDRMPLVLPPERYAAWIDPATPSPERLLEPANEPRLRAYPVSFVVNDPKNDSPACIEAIA
jgi:putative SOS response-associated peptidase YedK